MPATFLFILPVLPQAFLYLIEPGSFRCWFHGLPATTIDSTYFYCLCAFPSSDYTHTCSSLTRPGSSGVLVLLLGPSTPFPNTHTTFSCQHCAFPGLEEEQWSATMPKLPLSHAFPDFTGLQPQHYHAPYSLCLNTYSLDNLPLWLLFLYLLAQPTDRYLLWLDSDLEGKGDSYCVLPVNSYITTLNLNLPHRSSMRITTDSGSFLYLPTMPA